MSRISDHDLNMLILEMCKDGLLDKLDPDEKTILSILQELKERRAADVSRGDFNKWALASIRAFPNPNMVYLGMIEAYDYLTGGKDDK